MFLLSCAIIATVSFDIIHGQGYLYRPDINGWIKAHKVMLPWHKADKYCKYEGAEMASPINSIMLKEMQSLIGVNGHTTPYFIGAKVRYHPDIVETANGTIIEDMPVSDMIDIISTQVGECLVLSLDKIWSEPCDMRLPYICFKEREENQQLTRCGTFDTDYKFIETLNQCYKFRKENMTWQDCYFACKAEGGSLATGFSHYVDDIINKTLWTENDGDFAFTGYKLQDDWISVHGEIPDRYLYDGNYADGRCAAFSRSHTMYKYSCEEKLPCMCKMDPSIIKFQPPHYELSLSQ